MATWLPVVCMLATASTSYSASTTDLMHCSSHDSQFVGTQQAYICTNSFCMLLAGAKVCCRQEREGPARQGEGASESTQGGQGKPFKGPSLTALWHV